MALSLQLGDPERVAGFLTAGSEVAVFVTLPSPDAAAQENQARAENTQLLIGRVQVITVGNVQPTTTTTTESDGTQNVEEIPRAIVTLAVSQEEAQRLIYSSQKGTLYMALLTENSKVGKLPATDGTNVTK